MKEGRLHGKINALATENTNLKELLITIIYAHGGAYLLPRLEMQQDFALQQRQIDEGVVLRLVAIQPGQKIITEEGEEDDTESDQATGRIILP